MNGSLFSQPKYMNGVGFEKSGGTFVPKWSPPNPHRDLISHNSQRGSFRPTSMGLHHLSFVLSVWVVNTSFGIHLRGSYFPLVQWRYLFLGYRLGNAHIPYLWLCEQGAYTQGISLCHPFVQFIPFSHLAAYFLVYPWKAITSASFPWRDKFLSVLLKSASKLIPQFLNKVSEELRLEIPHSLFKLDRICFFVKGVLCGTCLVWLGMVYKFPDYIMVTKTW